MKTRFLIVLCWLLVGVVPAFSQSGNFTRVNFINADSATIRANPINGTIYYNRQGATPKFRVYENGTWKNLTFSGNTGWNRSGTTTLTGNVTIDGTLANNYNVSFTNMGTFGASGTGAYTFTTTNTLNGISLISGSQTLRLSQGEFTFLGAPAAFTGSAFFASGSSDPSPLSDSQVWYNTATNLLKARINGQTVQLAGGSTGSTDNAILRADGTSTFKLQNSSVIANDDGSLTQNLTDGSVTTIGSGFSRTKNTAISLDVIPFVGGPGVSGSTTGVSLSFTSGDGFGTGNTNAGNLYLVPGIGNGTGLSGSLYYTDTPVSPQAMEKGMVFGPAKAVPTAAPTSGNAFLYVSGSEMYLWNNGAGLPIKMGSAKTLWMNNNSSSLTGSTSETKVASFQVPSGTIGANDVIEIEAFFTKSGTAGNMTPRIYFNTSDAVGGIQVAVNSSNATNLWNGFERHGICKNSTGAQVWYNLSQASTDMQNTNSAKLSTSINFASGTWIIISNQNGSAADTSTLESIDVRIFRQ